MARRWDVDDIIFSVKTLREFGRPNHRFYYRNIVAMKKIDGHNNERGNNRAIEFTFSKNSNWEMPLIIGLMPIISKKHFNEPAF